MDILAIEITPSQGKNQGLLPYIRKEAKEIDQYARHTYTDEDDDSDASESYGQDGRYFNFTTISFTFGAAAIESRETCVAPGSGEASIVITCEYYHTDTIGVAAALENQIGTSFDCFTAHSRHARGSLVASRT
jgi:hypothetical protein